MGLEVGLQRGGDWTNQLGIAVNVSAVQLHSPHFPQLVHEALFQTGLAPHRLELEITETALIRDLTRALSTLRLLKALGVRIAMDDFGTGYSSLSNLPSPSTRSRSTAPSSSRSISTRRPRPSCAPCSASARA